MAPGVDLRVSGADDLERVARRLKEAGNKGLRRALLKRIREVNKDTITAIRANALATLPRRGGYADIIADSKIGTRTKMSGNSVGVSLQGRNGFDLRSLNRGRLRHPTYGHGPWVSQAVEPGFFTDPIEADLPRLQQGVVKAIDDIRDEIERGI